ncbi:hypothetical protein AUJ14_02385 [Candidatus Micrarchaeota archaeon CG1_02_55_22]|nr:MAG: hypothetical protein AUJ14_02385 [Candidatus Micrarchaeota archaeon CG1_02_55_22]
MNVDVPAATPYLLAIALIIIRLAGVRLESHAEKYHRQIISLSAGSFLAYLFLELLPRLPNNAPFPGYAFVFAGFAAYYLLEGYAFSHAHRDKNIRSEVAVLGFAADGILAGVILSVYSSAGYLSSFVLAAITLPLALHVLSTSAAFRHTASKLKLSSMQQTALAAIPLATILAWNALAIEPGAYGPVFSAITGIILFIAVHKTLPPENRVDKRAFVIGALAAIALLELKFLFA